MKTKLYSVLLISLLFSSVYLSPSFAQDYTTLRLPENANVRLGNANINSIQFSRNGKLLAVASSTSIWIYDVESSEVRFRLVGHVQTVSSVAFSPNSKTLASAGWDGTVRLWDTKDRCASADAH